ncbi:unnamed protein product, partial [marine sediment metagenome]
RLALWNLAEDAYLNLILNDLMFTGNLIGYTDGQYLSARGETGGHLFFKAQDTGVGLAEVARLQGTAAAYFQMTRPFRISPYAGALVATEGMFGYDGDDDKLHYRDAGAERVVAREDLFTTLVAFNDHSARHENGGADEISVAGLSGELADDQPPKAHTHLTVAETEVFDGSGNCPSAFTDLDLSAVVGENPALVYLVVYRGANDCGLCQFRKDGETIDWKECLAFTDIYNASHRFSFLVPTSDTGIIEWKCQNAVLGVHVLVEAFIK